MTPRISQIAITVVFLDEFDAIQASDPAVFQGGPEGTAVDKAGQFLGDLSANLAIAESLAVLEPVSPPEDLVGLTKAQLRGMSEGLGLKMSGSRAELIAQIVEHREKSAD